MCRCPWLGIGTPPHEPSVFCLSATTRRCDNDEPDGELCTGTLTFELGDLQAKCPVCGGWTGRHAPGRDTTP